VFIDFIDMLPSQGEQYKLLCPKLGHLYLRSFRQFVWDCKPSSSSNSNCSDSMDAGGQLKAFFFYCFALRVFSLPLSQLLGH
jgi:hypothetical protein